MVCESVIRPRWYRGRSSSSDGALMMGGANVPDIGASIANYWPTKG